MEEVVIIMKEKDFDVEAAHQEQMLKEKVFTNCDHFHSVKQFEEFIKTYGMPAVQFIHDYIVEPELKGKEPVHLAPEGDFQLADLFFLGQIEAKHWADMTKPILVAFSDNNETTAMIFTGKHDNCIHYEVENERLGPIKQKCCDSYIQAIKQHTPISIEEDNKEYKGSQPEWVGALENLIHKLNLDVDSLEYDEENEVMTIHFPGGLKKNLDVSDGNQGYKVMSVLWYILK